MLKSYSVIKDLKVEVIKDFLKLELVNISEGTINKFKLINEVKASAEIREIACRKCRDMSKKKQLIESS
jgi:hypothetical protein